MKDLLIVFFGGGMGSVLRYTIGLLLKRFTVGGFPWTTFSVNIVGCFLIGCFSALLLQQNAGNPTWRLLTIVGFCGGFTTFSTFSNESLTLFRSAQYSVCAIYVVGSLIVGLLAVAMGMKLTLKM